MRTIEVLMEGGGPQRHAGVSSERSRRDLLRLRESATCLLYPLTDDPRGAIASSMMPAATVGYYYDDVVANVPYEVQGAGGTAIEYDERRHSLRRMWPGSL